MIGFAIVYVLVVYVSIGVGFFDGVYLAAKKSGFPDDPNAASMIAMIVSWPYGIYLLSRQGGENRDD